MGCTETKQIGSEERSVIAAEEGLGLYANTASRVDSIIRKYSSNSLINHTHLTRIAEVLNLTIINTAPHTRVEEFFRKIANKDGFYNLKDLLIIGILLSEGEKDEKARLIYQIYDENLTDSIPLSDIKNKMLMDLAGHSAKNLPVLVTNEQTPFSNVLKNEKYMQDLESILINVVNKVSALFGNVENLNEKKFVEIFSSLVGGSLVTGSGWRIFMMEVFVAEPPKKQFNNPFRKTPK
jgi:hypothetical protein